MKKHIFSAVLLSLLFLGGISRLNAAVYNESGGLVIIEAENTDSALGNWEVQTSLTGYTGSGHLQFLGNTYLTGPADSPLEYTFKVNQSGLYYLHLHAAKTNVFDGVEVRKDVANDCYVRVEGDYNSGPAPYVSNGDNAPLSMLQSDSKYYTYTEQATDQWKWEDGFGNGNGNLNPNNQFRVAAYNFQAGETYKLVVSGRSKFFRLNRIMFRHTSVSKSAAQNLSNPESAPVVADSYVYDATEDFPSYTNGVVPYYKDTGNDCLGIRANIVEYRDLFATASRTFDGNADTYDVTITALRELDGECIYRFLVNSNVVGTVQNSETTVDYAPQKHVFRNITIPAGATISVESKTAKNDKVLEDENVPGVYAWARGRWTEVSLTPSSFSIVQPPDGRIALVSDGNSPDPDDIGAKAVAFGILKASGYSDRLVHVSHSCDLDPFTNGGSQTIDATNELRRQGKLYDLTNEGINFFGPYTNLVDHYNCRSNETAAVADLTAAIDASTAADPLWIIEAGEPDIIGYALSNSVPAKRQYVHVISHHPANDNSGDYVTWAEILAYGVTEHQIGDQNVGLKTGTNDWDWAYQNSDPGIAWIVDQLRYAEQDGVVTFQTDKFDCSDAGMMYWWLTGADSGGNSNSTPVEIKAMLLQEEDVPPDVVTTVPQVTNLGEWDVGSTWESGVIPTNGIDYTSALFLNVNNASSSFGGDSLTMQSDSWLRLRDAANTFVVSNLIMDGGQIYGATGNNVTFALDGTISVVSDANFRAYWNAAGPRNLNILSKISGASSIMSLASNDSSTHTLFINNAANDFSGTWVSQNGTIQFNNAGAVGTANIEVLDHGKLKILGDWSAYASLTVADAATASVDLGAHDWIVSSLVIGGSTVLEGYTYSVPQLNGLAANAVFTGTGTIKIGSPPKQGVVAGWDTWDSSVAPSASVLAPNVTASAVTTTEQKAWNTTDERGASDDGTWGTYVGPPAADTSIEDGIGANLEMSSASTGGTITFTINNNGTSDMELSAFHADLIAFRSKAARTYELSVLAGGDITAGVIYTSGAQEIYTPNGTPPDHDSHDDVDHSLLGLADHILEAGGAVQILISFSGGAGDSSGGHDLWVDNVAVSQVVTAQQTPEPVLDLSISGSDMVFDWMGGGFKVQSRTNLTEGIWFDVPGGDVPPVNVLPIEPEEFYRLIEQ